MSDSLESRKTPAIDPAEPIGAIELRDFGWKNYTRMLRLLDGRKSLRLIYLDGDLTLEGPDSSTLDAPESECVIELRDFGWKNYTRMLRLLDGRKSLRLIYLDGDLTLVSPISLEHEFSSRCLYKLAVEVAFGLGIPFLSAGQSTFRRRPKRAGVEGDETFYLGANEALIRGKKRIDLRIDPPPDLAIEVVVSHPADDAVRVWKRMGVREIWVANAQGVRILARTEDGKHAKVDISRVLPTLSTLEIHDWATRSTTVSENVWLSDLRTWVRDVLVPRLQQGT